MGRDLGDEAGVGEAEQEAGGESYRSAGGQAGDRGHVCGDLGEEVAVVVGFRERWK